MAEAQLGVIGGSGLYSIEGLQNVTEVKLDTPFGSPSDSITLGSIGSTRVAFLPRHGRGHFIAPSELNSRANIWAMKMLGVTHIISVNACGSLREEMHPRDVVVPDQLIDFTRSGRRNTFFGDGIVAHIGFAEPFCSEFSQVLAQAVLETGGSVHTGGTFITIEGPRFSTKAESAMFRGWGADIIGMTACPEAQLAREAEICYAVMAHVTDYDVWRDVGEPVSLEAVLANLQANTDLAKRAITKVAGRFPLQRTCGCKDALRNAIVTDPHHIPVTRRHELSLLLDRYLPRS